MGVPGEKPLGARERTNSKLNPHMGSMPGVDQPGHIGGRQALSPLRHPLAPQISNITYKSCYYLFILLVQ